MSDLHPSHEWGPHERGLRWVQCQNCKVLLHEPEAQQECSVEAVEAGRAERHRVLQRNLARVLVEETGGPPRASRSTESMGLWQTVPPWRLR